MSTATPVILLPGDPIPPYISLEPSLRLGPGTFSSSSRSSATGAGSSTSVVATRSGVMEVTATKSGKGKDKGKGVWIEGGGRRYVPAPQEPVLGTIIGKFADGYRVDIGSAHMAQLDGLAFESATKRNKPNLKIGALVYARVSMAHRDMEPELECTNAVTHKSDGFGELKGGITLQISLNFARSLFTPSPQAPLLRVLPSLLSFEMAIGLNGILWLSAPSVKDMVLLRGVFEGIDDGSLAVNQVENWIKKRKED